MKRATFPVFLIKKARIIGPLTRFDLIGLGLGYFALSAVDISGVAQLIVLAGGLMLLKYIQKKLPPGFFRFIASSRQLKWSYRLGGKS